MNKLPRDRALQSSPPTLVDCGCLALVYPDGSGIEIEYCLSHKDAIKNTALLGQLLAEREALQRERDQLQRALKAIRSIRNPDPTEAINQALEIASTALEGVLV